MSAARPVVVILGASGFLGSAVARELARTPIDLRLVSRSPSIVPPDPQAHVEVVTTDLMSPGAVAAVTDGADAVFPFAARIRGPSGWRITSDDVEARRTHVDLFGELVDSASGSPVIVFPGSNTQVGTVEAERIDGSEIDRPVGVYDNQKLAAETMLKDATRAGRVRAVSIRLPPVFGAPASPTTSDRGVVSTMIRKALAGSPLTMWHDGTPRRDLLNVTDAARAFVAAMNHVDAVQGAHYPIGTGRAQPLGEVFTIIADLVARRTGMPPVPVVSVPPPPEAENTDFRTVEVDPTAFMTATGWRCETSLADALDETVVALAAEQGQLR